MNSDLKADETLHRSIFKEKKQKILELEDFLTLVLHEYQQEKFGENSLKINETMSKLNLN